MKIQHPCQAVLAEIRQTGILSRLSDRSTTRKGELTMSKISEKLARRPDDIHQFDHNGQIKEFLRELHLENKFDYSENSADPGVQTIEVTDHPTHFLSISFWSGYSDRQENGYSLFCLPKSKFSHSDFVEVTNMLLHGAPSSAFEPGSPGLLPFGID